MFDAARDQRPAMRTLLRTRALPPRAHARPRSRDRKSTRLNSSHLVISYAVFCLKKKKEVETLSSRAEIAQLQAELRLARYMALRLTEVSWSHSVDGDAMTAIASAIQVCVLTRSS